MHAFGERKLGGATVFDPVNRKTILTQPVTDAGADHRIIFGEKYAHQIASEPETTVEEARESVASSPVTRRPAASPETVQKKYGEGRARTRQSRRGAQ